MKLIELKTDKNPLTIDFMWKPNRKREEDVCYQALYKDLCFTITDLKQITEIMNYFVEKCDESTSPQGLWESKGINYQTLMKDYKKNSDFDEILDHMIELLNISLSDEDRSYIACIDVSFPETWKVQIVCKQRTYTWGS